MITEESSLSKIIDYIDVSNNETIVISHLIHRDIGGCFEHCGGKRARCKMLPMTERRKSEDLVFLEELKFIADRLLIPHHLDVVLNTLQNRSENSESIVLNFKK